MSSNSLRDNWTRDAAGNYVDWTKPPYSRGKGIYVFLLEGEEAWRLEPAVRTQRIMEYYALVRRNWQRNRAGG